MKFKNRGNKSYIVDDVEGTRSVGQKLVWESRSVAVNCILIATESDICDENYVLISQRGEGAADYKGLWNIPCGYLDWDETTSEACIREVWEETNINLYSLLRMSDTMDEGVIKDDITKEWGTNSDVTNNRQNVSFRFGIYFYMKNFKKILNPSNINAELNEVGEIKWIPVSEIDNYDFAFGHDKLIKEYLKTL